MSREAIVTLALVLTSVAFPAAAGAQERRGPWFGIGGGYGGAGVSCSDICEDHRRESGDVVYLRGGWTLNERVLIGADFAYWSKILALEPGVKATVELNSLMGSVSFYPKATSGFFVKGGAGVTFIDTIFDVEGSKVTADLGKGLGLIAGVGYDLRLGRSVSLTPAVNFWYGRPGDLRLAGEAFASNWKHNVIDFTLGFTFP